MSREPRKRLSLTVATLVATIIGLSGCVSTMDMGNHAAKTEATGSAGGSNSQGASHKLEHCDATLGTIAVVEDNQAEWYTFLTREQHLGPTTPVLKLLIQQSNCFVVVDRGRAMANMQQERELAESGELRQNSNFGKGQMVSADFSLSPSVTFSNNNAGGAGAVVGGLLGPVGALVAGSIHAKEASTMLTLVDNRSSVQLAAAEGSAKNWDFGALGGVLGGGFGGLGGGYSNTAEGKVIVAAFMDSYNGIVVAARNYRAQNVEGGLGTGGHLAVQGGQQVASATQAPKAGMTPQQAQCRLNQLGFPVGSPDGVFGKKSVQQLKLFQQSKGLPQTGQLDDTTVEALQ